MPTCGARCYELRINDAHKTWRILYRLDQTAVIILAIFEKKTPQTPDGILELCRQRLKEYEAT